MRRRRRPVLRTAALAGGGAALYHAGKSSGANAQASQDAQMEQPAPQQAAPMPAAPAPAPAGPSEDAIARLKELGQLHDQGVLTDEEFAAQKAKLLA